MRGVDFSGQRVAVIGTGSSGVQIISAIAAETGHLHVFHRTPGYCVPLRNHPMPEDHLRRVKANYREWRAAARYASFGGWVSLNYAISKPITESALEVSPAARETLYEEHWRNGGLAFYNVYPDVYTDKTANDTLAEFLRKKIRARISDAQLAEVLTPTYPALTKRLIAETDYYEVYNRDNVTLLDLRKQGIGEITRRGIRVGANEYYFDSIVFATATASRSPNTGATARAPTSA